MSEHGSVSPDPEELDHSMDPRFLDQTSYIYKLGQSPDPEELDHSMDPRFLDQTSYIYKLGQYVDERNWPEPKYRILNSIHPSKSMFTCRLFVFYISSSSSSPEQTREFSTEIYEFSNPFQAMSSVAKRAYEWLRAGENTEFPLQFRDEVVRKGRSRTVATFSICCDPDFVPRRLRLPLRDKWKVYVTHIKSLNEVYVRISGKKYSKLFYQMRGEMNAYYFNGEIAPAKSVEINHSYALIKQNFSFRVVVTGVTKHFYEVFYVDIGYVELVKRTSLFDLPLKFYDLPAQAICCSLDGLDDYDFPHTVSPDVQTAVAELLLPKKLCCEITTREPLFLTANLYTITTNEDVNLLIKEKVDKCLRQAPHFDERTTQSIQKVTVDKSGQVFIQVRSWVLDILNDELAHTPSLGVSQDIESLTIGKIYIWRNGPARVKVCNVNINGEVFVELIDTEEQKTINFTELYELNSNLLPNIPKQAIPVLLNDVSDGKLKPHQVEDFFDLMQCNAECLAVAKIISLEKDFPVVEFFSQIGYNNFFSSVNQRLFHEEYFLMSRMSHLSIAETTNTTTSQEDDGLQNQSLPPSINSKMAVKVVQVSNPLDLTIMPADCLENSNKLSDELLTYYSSTSSEPHTPKIGESVASCVDGVWFRVKIEKFLGKFHCLGSFLDDGNMDVFPINDIRVLPEKFKNIPVSKFRAQIHGIELNIEKWTVEDCVRLREMLCNTNIISYVRDIFFKNGETILSLEIIDETSKCNIAQQLIEEGRVLPGAPVVSDAELESSPSA